MQLLEPRLLQSTYLELWMHRRQNRVQEDEDYGAQELTMPLAHPQGKAS